MSATARLLPLQASFDFGNPLSLNPSVAPLDYGGGKLAISDKVFTDGPVNISFSYGAPSGGSSLLLTHVNQYTDEITYSLMLTQGSVITFKSNGKAYLDSIRISDDSTIGDLSLMNGQPGKQNGRFWRAGDRRDVDSVSFMNTSQQSLIQKITVYYTTPSDVLEPYSTYLTDINGVDSLYKEGIVLSSFQSMSLSFAATMKEDPDTIKYIHVTGKYAYKDESVDMPMTVNVNDNKVTLSLKQALTEDGDFSVVIPSHSFYYPTGTRYDNKELIYKFKVFEPRNTFVPTLIDPDPGYITEFKDVYLKYPKPIKLSKNTLALTYNDEFFSTVNLTVTGINKDSLKISFEGNVDQKGTYKIVMPEGTVHTTAYETEYALKNDRWNPLDTLKYELVAEIPHVDSETMTLAKELLSLTGIGYPSKDSKGRAELDSLVHGATIPTDSALNVKIQSFYDENDVALPEAGKWYSIASVNSKADSLFLAYQSGSIVLSKNNQSATEFCANPGKDNTFVFTTRDGKVLHVLRGSGEFSSTSERNLTNDTTYINNLVLSKLAVEGKGGRELLGKLSIFGPLGNYTKTGKAYNAFALVDHSTSTILTDSVAESKDAILYFEDGKTSAFAFTEVDEPQPLVPIIKLQPDSIGSCKTPMALIFTNLNNVSLVDGTIPYFITKQGEKVASKITEILTSVEGRSNMFMVNADGLTDGSYALVLPEGTFSYGTTEDGRTVANVLLTIDFKIKHTSTDFTATMTNYGALQIIERNEQWLDFIEDVELNDLVLFASVPDVYSGFVPDPTKIVKIVDYYSNVTVAEGYFEVYEDFSKDYPDFPDCQAIKLKLTKPIGIGDLQYSPSLYSYVIPEAAFGDANFGRYLDGDPTVRPEDCIVNAYTVAPHFLVNNDKAKASKLAIYKSKAEYLIGKEEVGYPSKNSKGRIALKKVTDSGSNNYRDYLSAIDQFVNEKEVIMPSDDVYYKVYAVNVSDRRTYLSYDGLKVGVTEDENKATGFKIIKNPEGSYRFLTGNGKLLCGLSLDKNVTEDYREFVNDIFLERADIQGKRSYEKTLGMFSIMMETEDQQTEYQQIDVYETMILDASSECDNFYDSSTNCFILEEVANSDIPVPEMSASFSPLSETRITQLSTFYVTFSGTCDVSVADKSKVTLTDVTGKAWYPQSITPAESDKSFVINFSGVRAPAGASGDLWYVLTVGEGTFVYAFADRVIPWHEEIKRYKISATDGISNILSDDIESKVYDLQGRRTMKEKLPKGLYIQNGKKKVVR